MNKLFRKGKIFQKKSRFTEAAYVGSAEKFSVLYKSKFHYCATN